MRKIKNRFIALLVVFTSIIAFIPAELFDGQAANAATISSDANAILVYNAGQTTALTATTETTSNDSVYSALKKENSDGSFDIVVKDVTTKAPDLEAQAKSKMLSGSGTVSGIIAQEVDIISINDIPNTTVAGQAEIAKLGITISVSNDPNSSRSTIGKTISGLPLGVNRIGYKVKVTTEDLSYTAATSVTTNGVTTTTPASPGTPDVNTKEYSTQYLKIYWGSDYVTSKIQSMVFKAYIGAAKYFNDDDSIDDSDIVENNTKPFLYTTKATGDSKMPLKYNFDVPDSIDTLKYVMTFEESFSGATIIKNGTEAVDGTDYSISGNNLTGSLGKPSSSDLIVIKLNDSSTSIQKVYSIEISYNSVDAVNDYSINKAGIIKYDYASDDSVKAYIGKKFVVTKDTNDLPVYTGDIYIDKKAKMISIDPTIVRNLSADNVAYVVTNIYDSGTQKSVLKNGHQFIDFMAGSSNQIQVLVYEGANGSTTSPTTLLARYLLNVNLLTSDNFALDMAFANSSGTSDNVYLTQPGVKANTIDFSTSRRTYDLYSSDPVKVSFALKSENDNYTGIRSGKNEYLRVWLADSVDSNSLTEATASVNNTLDSNNTRSTSIDVNLNGAKKMVVQAYYDEFTQATTSAAVTVVRHAVDDDYVFYLPNNYDKSDTSTGNTSSTNALLNSLKITDGTFADSDGNTTFSSSVFDYTVTVPKGDTSAKITAIAQDDNVKSIVATVVGTGTSYDLVSGTSTTLTLSTTGKTSVNIVVTAQDGTTTKTYALVIKNNTKSSNVSLKNVILNPGDFTFDSTASTTKVHVSQSTTSIKVTPVPSDTNATVTVNGTTYTGSTITVSLKGAQKTSIPIVVTSEDGTASKTYTLDVYRTDSSDWNNSSSSDDSTEADQYYDDYYDCWVDTTKYEEWGKISSKPAYFDKNNRQVKSAWISTGKKMYYLDSSGYRSSGWKVDDTDGKTYYLDPTTGEMRTGWMNLNNSWYYLGLNGVMQKGWLNLNKKWYYFTPNGQMVINQSMFIDGEVCNFGQDGAKY